MDLAKNLRVAKTAKSTYKQQIDDIGFRPFDYTALMTSNNAGVAETRLIAAWRLVENLVANVPSNGNDGEITVDSVAQTAEKHKALLR